MGLFICSKCECVENTALGWWWSKDFIRLVLPEDMKQYEKGHGLCSECLPLETEFEDGTRLATIDNIGKWHEKFPKQHIDDFMKENKDYIRRGNQLIYKT